jgi:sRNA-binding carbon storage regulator CsrA
MLVVARKAADRLKLNNTSQDFAVVRIVVPASDVERVSEVTLCELRPANGSARIGFEADRDIAISRLELIKH